MGLVLPNSSSEANKCAIEGLYSLFCVFYSLILSMFCMLFFLLQCMQSGIYVLLLRLAREFHLNSYEEVFVTLDLLCRMVSSNTVIYGFF